MALNHSGLPHTGILVPRFPLPRFTLPGLPTLARQGAAGPSLVR